MHKLALCSRAFALCGSALVEEPFDDPDYIFELKHDGFPDVQSYQNAWPDAAGLGWALLLNNGSGCLFATRALSASIPGTREQARDVPIGSIS